MEDVVLPIVFSAFCNGTLIVPQVFPMGIWVASTASSARLQLEGLRRTT